MLTFQNILVVSAVTAFERQSTRPLLRRDYRQLRCKTCDLYNRASTLVGACGLLKCYGKLQDRISRAYLGQPDQGYEP
jgi:hypothetical protein